MNLGIFTGRLGRDAEIRSLPGGDRVANFPVAVEVGSKTEPKTMWLDASMWGKRGEALAPHLVKGLKVTVSGRILVEEYTKKDRTQGYRLTINVDQVDLHGNPSGERSPAAGAKPAGRYDDDTPF